MSAPVKKCEVCDDTGSKSRDIGGDLDCVACTAADNRAAMRNKLGPMTYTEELYAWRAYQLGKAAAAPVVPVAAQPVVPEGWKLVPEEPTYEMFNASAKIDNEMFAGGSSHGADDGQVWAAMYDAAPAAPSIEAQPAGEIERDAARYRWLCKTAFDSSITQEQINKEVDASMAQGEKA